MRLRDRALTRAAISVFSLALGAAIWEVAGSRISPAFLSRFSVTLARLYEFSVTGVLAGALRTSLILFFTGLFFAVVVGVSVGLLLARVRPLRVALEPYIMVLYATPDGGADPVHPVDDGFRLRAKVLMVFLFAVFPMLYNTIEGARSIKPELLEVARSFRSGEWAIWREVMRALHACRSR